MIMKNNKIIFTFLSLLIFLNSNSFSQSKDFQIWTGGSIDIVIIDDLSFEVEEEFRLENNSTNLGKALTNIGLSYKLTDFMNVSGTYRFYKNNSLSSGFYNEHRYYFDLSFSEKINKFKLKYRSRYQSNILSELDTYLENEQEIYNRNKFSVIYNISNNPISPYIAFESYLKLTGIKKFDKNRCRVGFEYKINKKSELDISYMIQTEINSKNPDTDYILGVSYGYSF